MLMPCAAATTAASAFTFAGTVAQMVAGSLLTSFPFPGCVRQPSAASMAVR